MAVLRTYLLIVAGVCTLHAAKTSLDKVVPPPVKAVVSSTAARMPLWFEPNVGQSDSHAPFFSKTENQAVFLSATGMSVLLRDERGAQSVRLDFKGSSGKGNAEGVDPLPSVSNYFIGNDRSKWRLHVPHFAKVRMRDVYPGIDVVYYSNRLGNLEYDFVIGPAADPTRIQLAYLGTKDVSIDSEGNLRIALDGRTLLQHKPRVYQVREGKQVEVAAGYKLIANGSIQFALAGYDRSRALVVDPVLDYSVYLGGKAYDTAIAIAVDAAGNKYVTGTTGSADLVSNSLFQTRFGGATDAYLAKFDTAGTLRYFTYMGGSQNDTGRSIVVDSAGNVYIGGDTNSGDFPEPASNDPTNRFAGGSADVFVAKIAAAGDNIIYAKYIGGGSDDFIGGGPDVFIPNRSDEFGNGLAVDSTGSAYITGYTKSTDFPTTADALMQRTKAGGESAFVTKLNPAGTQIAYSTVIEGNGKEGGEGIAIDKSGNIYVTGYTTSTNFPGTSTGYQTSNRSSAGFEDAFVMKLDSTAKKIVYSTYLGGFSRDLGFRIAVDSAGSAYVTGYTQSSDFPVSLIAPQPRFGGSTDAFITKLSPDGKSLTYSTYLGGSGDDWGFADIAVDANGNAFVAGYTTSTDFPVVNAFQPLFGQGDTHGFVAELNQSGTAWALATYFGGSQHDEIHGLALDPVRNTISIAGFTSSPNLPSAKNAFVGDTTQGRYDAFIAQISGLGVPGNVLVTDPRSLTFNVSAGAAPVSQTISVSSSGAALQFIATNANPANSWLTVTQSGASTPATVTVTVDPRNLGAIATTGSINLDVVGGSRTSIPILVAVNASGPVLTSVSPTSIAAGSPDTTITITGAGFTNSSVVLLNGAAATTQYVSPSTLTATLPAALLRNAGSVTVAVSANGSTSIGATITVSASNIPIISATGVLNGATNQAGPVAPGEIITIKGSGFGPSTLTQAQLDSNGQIATLLANTRVLINGTAAPLVYSTQNQVSAIVPYNVTTGQASIQVEYQGQKSAPVNVAVALANPGIFTSDSTGSGAALVFNSDNSINSPSNPAPKGSVVYFYATGEGQVNPAGVTGGLVNPQNPTKPVQDVRVKVNGLDATVIYAGGVGNLVEGLMQVNARIPDNAPSGPSIPLVLQVGGISSPFTVTISIQ